jgi:hypothetical protein
MEREVVVEQRATEARSQAACRRLVTLPLGLAAGALAAGAALARWNASPLQALACGLVTLFLATRARDWIEARTVALFSDDAGVSGGAAVALAIDLAVGAAAGIMAAPLLDAGILPGLGAGAMLAGLWSFVVDRLFCGDTVDRAVDFLLSGSQSSDFAQEPILADGEALEREGRADAAILKYREVVQHRPGEPEAYLRAARLLSAQGRAGEAAGLLRQARRQARLSEGHELIIGRQLAELALGPLADPTQAAGELALLATRFRGTAAGDAAERDLQQLRGAMR